MANVVEIKRPQTDFGALGKLVGQAINPQQQITSKLLPLFLQEQFKSNLSQKRSEAFLDRIERQGLKGKFSFGPGGELKGFTPFTQKELVSEGEAAETLTKRATPVSPVKDLKQVEPGFLGRFGLVPQARAEGVIPKTPRVSRMIKDIQSEEDLDEFISKSSEAKKKGWSLNEYNSVLEAFGQTKLRSF